MLTTVAKKCRRVALFTAIVAAVSGCRTNKDILDDYERSTVAGDYAAPIAEIEEKAEAGGVDELMWRLHAGGSRYLLGDHDRTVFQFDKAEDAFADFDANGVFGRAADTTLAIMTNDRALPFAGNGGDRVFTCLYKAIDFAAVGDFAAVRTELNRAAQHQDNWLFERRKEIGEVEKKLHDDANAYAKKENSRSGGGDADKAEAAADKAMTDAAFGVMIKEKCGFDPSVDGNLEVLSRKDWLNIYAEHVTGVFRWLQGEEDAKIYLREASEIKGDNAMLRRDDREARSGVKPTDQVWIYIEDGLCPIREEWRLDLPLVFIPYANRFVMYAGMALPYLRYRGCGLPGYKVGVEGSSFRFEQLEDVDRLSKNEFDVYFRGALAREITRTIVKAGVQAGLGIGVEAANDDNVKLGLRLAQISAASYAASVTQADLRSWTGLPKKVYAARIDRPADGKIIVSGLANEPVAEMIVPAGNSMIFIRKPSASAPAVVKAATFKY